MPSSPAGATAPAPPPPGPEDAREAGEVAAEMARRR